MKFLNSTKTLVNLALMIFLLLASCYLLLKISFEIEDREKFNLCLENAFSQYKQSWKFQCKQNNKSEECDSLPLSLASHLSNDRLENQSVCVKLYR